MTDLEITGGRFGINIGNQQFTIRNVHITNTIIGVNQIWDWGITYQDLTITNCSTAFSMRGGGPSAPSVGSVTIIDSTIQNCPVFVDSAYQPGPNSAGSLILENIALGNVPIAVQGPNGTVLPGSNNAAVTITAWGQVHKYDPSGPSDFQGSFVPPTRPAGLLASGSNRYYTKSKPQYATEPVSSFLSVRDAGATGDGSTDDTAAIQAALYLAVSSGRILFFDQGDYKVTNTLVFPAGSRIIGESYPVILATGSTFSNMDLPVPVVQIGYPGESGHFEWSNMIVSTKGSTPGAVLIEWNLMAGPSQGSGMWDVHTRIGGFTGSELGVAECPTSAPVSPQCEAAFMAMRITRSGNGAYLENVWFWTADHDIDNPSNTQISVYTGRGLLVEGRNTLLSVLPCVGPATDRVLIFTRYATAVEHYSLYQYQFSGARNLVAGFVQTETPCVIISTQTRSFD